MKGMNGDPNALLGKFETELVNPAIELLALGAFIVFVWGVVDFIRNADNDEKRGTGAKHMLWGLVGLVIIFGAGALVNLLKSFIAG
jgi:hypothetical protein